MSKKKDSRQSPVTSHSVLFCDDIRREINGKLSLIGTYPTGMNVRKDLYALPRLCVFLRMTFKETLAEPIEMRITYDAKEYVLDSINVVKGTNVFVFEMSPFDVLKGGTVKVLYSWDGKNEEEIGSMLITKVDELQQSSPPSTKPAKSKVSA